MMLVFDYLEADGNRGSLTTHWNENAKAPISKTARRQFAQYAKRLLQLPKSAKITAVHWPETVYREIQLQ